MFVDVDHTYCLDPDAVDTPNRLRALSLTLISSATIAHSRAPAAVRSATTASISVMDFYLQGFIAYFDAISAITSSPGVLVSVKSPSDLFNAGLRSGTLTLSFTNFKPGAFVQLNVELDDDNGNEVIMDYRTTLFHLGETDGSNDGNTYIKSTFASGQILLGQLPDYALIDGPPFVYRQTTKTGVSVNAADEELLVGGPNQHTIVFDADLGKYLQYADDPLGILQALIRLDLDLLVRFDDEASLGDLAMLADNLRDLLGIPVDVVSEGGLHGRFADRVRSRAVPV